MLYALHWRNFRKWAGTLRKLYYEYSYYTFNKIWARVWRSRFLFPFIRRILTNPNRTELLSSRLQFVLLVSIHTDARSCRTLTARLASKCSWRRSSWIRRAASSGAACATRSASCRRCARLDFFSKLFSRVHAISSRSRNRNWPDPLSLTPLPFTPPHSPPLNI